jgi:hypothetical protein
MPPTSSSLGDEKHVPSLLLSTAARDPVLDCSTRQGSFSEAINSEWLTGYPQVSRVRSGT